ncbi:hypothetical protein SLEP1_g17565 [Rubroshorea leprosula]|uniref:Disease resistance R13L4/SHOC-2-like LRR domain-containing protein n=1 Tax=Rubroshorea leprosula TaxID=152421 RepID=A0AAV5J292_9ROSI|nr:hypothetical protein SLEP1_g17565 [Rubroshorea leprosula]
MSSPDSGLGGSGSGQHVLGKKLNVQEIIEKIQDLNNRLSKARDQTKSLPDAKNFDGNLSNNSYDNVGGNASIVAIDGIQLAEENVATDPTSKEKEEKKDDHKDENSKKGPFDHQKVKGELEKLCKELEFMKLAFQKLKKFEDDLTKPFKTLEKNVDDIEKDLPSAPNRYSSAKQVQSNLRVLRNNITKIKIQIPLQHHATQTNSESRGYKETVASKEHDDLPNLSHEKVELKQSAYCVELFKKYETLKDDRLKLCLLSFAIFPENAKVKKRLLRYWWVGENIILPEEEEKKFTNETLEKLVKMEFIEPVNKKYGLSPRSYRMYPIIRSALITKARKEQFFDYDHHGNPTMNFSECYKACLVKAEEESPRSISKHFSRHEEELGKLETLFNVSEQFPDFKGEWFSKMKSIRVLYLGRWESSTDRHIEVESPICFEGLSKMKNLRFLSLQGISGIKSLPNSLCQAAKLRILDLRACHNLEELPDSIGSLKKLTHLDISECYLLDQMPKELSSLLELKIFKGFVISDHKKTCSLEELKALQKLEKLSINIIDREYKAERLGSAISKFSNLEKLKVAWGGATLTPAGAEEKSEETNSGTESQGQGGQHKRQVEKGAATAKPCSVAKKLWGKLKNRNKERYAAQSTVSSQEKTESSDNLSLLRRFGHVAFFTSKLREAASLNQEMTPEELVWSVTKLELQCYPETTPPNWLVPGVLPKLKNLYIKGGRLHNLPEMKTRTKWKAKILCLKYLSDLKTDWKELREMFPDLEYLERVRCPKVMFCPCDGDGWCHLTTLLKDGVES